MTTSIRPSFSPWHIPPLFVATTFTLGGLLPLWKPVRAIREFGLPDRIATCREAQTCFAVYGSRMSMFGIAIYTFYLRGEVSALDTILAILPVAGVVDGYLCWREGVPGVGLFRFVSSLVLGGYGYFGLTWTRN
ncbi:hypothetical protein B0T10DRAFT_496474 [Thelonectria olida]|uniref:Uncharacterized protein n=1 Tax=Thelonectria olida TaxID=1576542 RepID=A0A9P9AJP1_9HYPO|nr:hypothetical protein B0T10DRAFT_496474 [Thelonectria olida]